MLEMKMYDCLVVDMVNFCYRTFKPKTDKTVAVSPSLGGNGTGAIYQNSVHSAIKTLEKLSKAYLRNPETDPVYLLFDNYFSRADLQSTFLYADRKDLKESYKANRKKESKEFYQSINFLKYYYMIGPDNFYTVQIPSLEADDLVYPLLSSRCQNQDCLLVTTDLDWARYLTSRIDWLPDFSAGPERCPELSEKLGFEVSEKNIILYKAIFGDPSDNIEPLAKKTSENWRQFLELLGLTVFPDDLFTLARDPEVLRKYPLLQEIIEIDHKKYNYEGRLNINLYLVSAIPCSQAVFSNALIRGRNSGLLFDSVRKAIGLEEHKPKFVFGKLNVKKGIAL